jgi:hypothetical protein
MLRVAGMIGGRRRKNQDSSAAAQSMAQSVPLARKPHTNCHLLYSYFELVWNIEVSPRSCRQPPNSVVRQPRDFRSGPSLTSTAQLHRMKSGSMCRRAFRTAANWNCPTNYLPFPALTRFVPNRLARHCGQLPVPHAEMRNSAVESGVAARTIASAQAKTRRGLQTAVASSRTGLPPK